MPRIQRKKSNSGYYHIMIRGNERRNIFHDEEDKGRFIETLFWKKQKEAFYLPAFCLMDNHVHLIVGEGHEDIARVMKRITVSYVFYFNEKYKRVGHLFQDRFLSAAIENDRYLLSLTRYIHQNPVQAGMVKTMSDYKWSSYNGYVQEKSTFQHIIDREIILRLFSNNNLDAQKLYRDFMNENSQEVFDDLTKERIMDEEEAKSIYNKMLNEIQIDKDGYRLTLPDEFVIKFKAETNLSIRKIAEITGLSKNKVHRILQAI